MEGVSLVGFRGFLQSLFATKEAVVCSSVGFQSFPAGEVCPSRDVVVQLICGCALATQVSNMDSDGSGIVTNDEFKRFVTRTLGLTSENADDVLGSLCQARC